jgi:hypothetical protein
MIDFASQVFSVLSFQEVREEKCNKEFVLFYAPEADGCVATCAGEGFAVG